MSIASTQQRRLVLTRILKLMVLVGVIYLFVPFLASFSISLNDEEGLESSHWVLTVPVSALEPAKVKTLSWSGGPVWVYTRTKDDIKSLKYTDSMLRDPASEASDQPSDMKNEFRSADSAYFVFIPIENKRSCQVRFNDEETIKFIDPCFGAEFDTAGRIFNGSGHKDQNNLAVPLHIIEGGMLKVGIWLPK